MARSKTKTLVTKTSLDRLFVELKKHLVADNVTNELAILMDQKYIRVRIMDLCSRNMELEEDKLKEIMQLVTIALLQVEKDGTVQAKTENGSGS